MRLAIQHRQLRVGLVAIITVLAVVLQAGGVAPRGVRASNYLCNNHCYAYADWQRNGLMGAQATLAYLDPNTSGGPGFVTQEIWLRSFNPPNNTHCVLYTGQPQTNCWVEGGVEHDGFGNLNCKHTGACYFWADLRPSSPQDPNSNFYFHPVSDFQPGDIGQPTKTAIYGNAAAHNFTIQTITPHGTYYNLSSNNLMIPNDYWVGTELVGQGGILGNAVLPNSDFNNIYYTTDGANWTAETLTGSITPYNDHGPLLGSWIVNPAPGNAGGDFRAWCPGSGYTC